MEMLTAAVAADPSYVEAHNNLGVLQKDIGLTHEVHLCLKGKGIVLTGFVF